METPPASNDAPRPLRLRAHARLHYSAPRGRHVLLLPERAVWLNASAAEVLSLLDGERDASAVLAALRERHPRAPVEEHLRAALAWLRARGLLEGEPAPGPLPSTVYEARPNPERAEAPMALLCELTYRCPLRCGYCSNPLDFDRYNDELDTDAWLRVLDEAAALGVVQCHFSGGEPLLRADLETLVERARALGLYTNLITSAWALEEPRLRALRDAGLEHVQVSLQHTDAALADQLAGARAHEHKLAMARRVRALGMALSVNVVLHAGNVDATEALIALAESLGAGRIELASTQFHGWALRNREALLPTREQVERAAAVAARERARLHGRMDVLYVLPDYYTDAPKPCMDGWGRRFLTVTPTGEALPCPGAHALPLPSASVRDKPLAWLWFESPRFQSFRGEGWMQEPCSSCDKRSVDHAGCRCQAFALTGDARSADPACKLAPAHHLVREARERSLSGGPRPEVLYRVRTRGAP